MAAFVAGMCVSCETDTQVAPDTKRCIDCSICTYCLTTLITQPNTARCDNCICHNCRTHKDERLFTDDRDEFRGKFLCKQCWTQVNKDRLCIHCHTNYAEIFRRGDKRPRVCPHCINKRDSQKRYKYTHYCSFCPNKTQGTYSHSTLQLACDKCLSKRHCGIAVSQAKRCTPPNQCKRCLTFERDAALESHRIAQRRSTHTCEASPAGSANCYACAWERDPFLSNELTFWPAKNPLQKKINKSDRLISAEIEISDMLYPEKRNLLKKTVNRWKGQIVHDGSLTNTGHQCEINTAPASGDNFIKQIDEICEALSSTGANTNDTCGLHIHVDARDMTWQDLKKFLLLYAKLEPALIRTQPAPRIWQSRYTYPCGLYYANNLKAAMHPKPDKETMLTNIYGTTQAPPRHNKYDRSRYHAISIHSWAYRGTIEARMHAGTVVARKIKDWGMLWAAIVDKANSLTARQIQNIDTDPVQLLMSIAPTQSIKNYLQARLNDYSHAHDNYWNAYVDMYAKNPNAPVPTLHE